MQKFNWKTVFKYRNPVYGVAAVWILFYHVHNIYWLGIPVLSGIIGIGNMAVDVFLILSAVGLSYSVEKNNAIDFYKNRLKRTYITYLLIMTPFFIWKYFIAASVSWATVPDFLLELSSLSYFWTAEGEFPVWYVPCILLFYAFYPLLYKLYRKNKLYIVGLIVVSVAAELTLLHFNSPVLTVTERTFSRIPIFLIGILISDCVKNEKKIHPILIVLSFAVIALTMFIYPVNKLYWTSLNIIYIRYLYGVMAVSLLVVVAFIMELVKKFKITEIFIKMFSYLGGISLEIYLVHIAILRILSHYNLQHRVHYSYYYISVLIAGIIMGILFSKLAQCINKPKKVNI